MQTFQQAREDQKVVSSVVTIAIGSYSYLSYPQAKSPDSLLRAVSSHLLYHLDEDTVSSHHHT